MVPDRCYFSHPLHIIFLKIIIVHTDVAAVSAATNVIIEAALLSANNIRNVPSREIHSLGMPIIAGPLRECNGGFFEDIRLNYFYPNIARHFHVAKVVVKYRTYHMRYACQRCQFYKRMMIEHSAVSTLDM
ncbi:uncharacterized protein Bfra_000249 [Botrytis fragariae]|uniref:Uncharacterized protein n=1 Tax=Botrytis fragariae TaxID=1964551 RepID=A0A8H6B2Z4_9HELO|nr:uncharacterized protein Bfra_000249 [Botrytis fragariae]KAF5878082.1 hypothetical protein Bfra_000249 [Botrytis fragariae]